MRPPAFCVLLGIASVTWAQDDAFDGNPFGNRGSSSLVNQESDGDPLRGGEKTGERKKESVPNPFEQAEMMMGGMMGEMGGMGMEMEGTMEDEMEDMMDMGMGMGGYGGPSPEQIFRQGLQRAIVALRKATNDDTKETLRGHIRNAFEERYEKMITARKQDIARLKQSVAKLEAEMKRREAAKDRVVQLQLQSVQLAAEGILEPNELLPAGR